MAKKLLLLLLLVSVSFAANAQFRQHRDYVGGSFVRGDLTLVDDSIGLNESFDLNAIDLRLGVEMARWFHLEGRVAFGINDKSVGGVEVSIGRLIGAHGVFSLRNETRFRPYAVAGITYGEVDLRIPGFSTDETETDVSFGVGVDAEITDSLDLFVEYMQYIDKGNVELSGLSLGLKFDL